MKNKFEKIFDSGKEMLDFLQAGKDLYNPETDAYVFVYSEDKAIAYYSVSKEDAKKYAKIEADTGEYWGSNLGVGGYIYENQLSENYDKSKVSSRNFCNEHFNEGAWVKTTDYLDYLEEKAKYERDIAVATESFKQLETAGITLPVMVDAIISYFADSDEKRGTFINAFPSDFKKAVKAEIDKDQVRIDVKSFAEDYDRPYSKKMANIVAERWLNTSQDATISYWDNLENLINPVSEELGLAEWQKTDDMQWRRSTGFSSFELVEVRETPDGYIYVSDSVDLRYYDEKEITSCIESYGYKNLSEMEDTYGDDTKGVIAECIFEQTQECELICFGDFQTEDEAAEAAQKYVENQK